MSKLSPRGLPMMDEKEGESAVLGAVAFTSHEDAEKFIDWKLEQGVSVRYHHKSNPIIVEFEP